MQNVRTLDDHADSVYDVCFSPEGKHIVSSGRDGHIVLWSTEGVLEQSWIFERFATNVRFSPSGDLIAAGASSGSVGLWKRDGTPLGSIKASSVEALAFTPDGARILIGGSGGELHVINVARREVQHTIRVATGPLASVSLSPAGDLAVIAAATDGIAFVDLTKGRLRKDLAFAARDVLVVYRCSFSSDGNCAASVTLKASGPIGSGSNPDRHQIWIWRPGEEQPHTRALLGHIGWTAALAFSPSGALLASGGQDAAVHVWNPAFHSLVGRGLEHEGNVHSVAFSPDESLLASASADHTVRLWSVAERARLGRERPTARGDEHLTSLLHEGAGSEPGRAQPLLAFQRIARTLVRLEDHAQMQTAIDDISSLVIRTGALSLANGISQTLEVWSEQAKREEDARTVLQCERALAALRVAGRAFMRQAASALAGSSGHYKRTSPKNGEQRAITEAPAATRPEHRPARKALFTTIVSEVAAGTLTAAAARSRVGRTRVDARDLTVALHELHNRTFHLVVDGELSNELAMAAAELTLLVAQRTGDRYAEGRAEQLVGRLHAVAHRHAEAMTWLLRAQKRIRADPAEGARANPDSEHATRRFACQILGDLGNVYRNAGKLRDAREAYARAVDIARQDHWAEELVTLLNNLAVVYQDLGDTDAQMDALLEARAHASALLETPLSAWAPKGATRVSSEGSRLDINDDLRHELRAALAAIESGVGQVCMVRGDYASALHSFQKALALVRRQHAHLMRGGFLGNVGHALRNLGQIRRADRAYRASLAAAERIGDHPTQIVALHGLSLSAAALHDREGEERLVRRAVAIGEQYGLTASLVDEYEHLARIVTKQDPREARALIDRALLAGERLRAEVDLPEQAEGLQQKLARIYATLCLAEADAHRPDSACEAAERSRAALFLRRSRGAGGEGLRPLTAPEVLSILRRLGSRALLVSYFFAGDELFAFVARGGADRIVLERGPADVKRLDRALAAFQREVVGFGQYGDIGESWLEIGDMVMRPLRRHVREGDVLLFVGHGPLHSLPIHALQVDGARLLAHCAVAYLPSASALPALLERSPSTPTAPLVIGAHFEREARDIARVLRVKAWLAGETTDKRALQDGPKLLPHVAVIEGATDRRGEHQPLVLPTGPDGHSLLCLRLLVRLQDGHQAFREAHRPTALVALGLHEMETPPEALQGPTNRERFTLTVDVGPLQSEGLAQSKAHGHSG